MAKKVRLHATQESDEANYAGNRYRVDNSGDVWVDEDAVAPLVEKGGFVPDPMPVIEVPHGNIRVIHTSDPTALCSHRGQEFNLEADGSLIVPVEAVEHLAAHGFLPVSEERQGYFQPIIAPIFDPPVEVASEPALEPVVEPIAAPIPDPAPENRASAP